MVESNRWMVPWHECAVLFILLFLTLFSLYPFDFDKHWRKLLGLFVITKEATFSRLIFRQVPRPPLALEYEAKAFPRRAQLITYVTQWWYTDKRENRWVKRGKVKSKVCPREGINLFQKANTDSALGVVNLQLSTWGNRGNLLGS